MLFNLSNRAMDFLLKILIRHNVPNVPKSMYFLMKHSKQQRFDTVSLSKGSFFYFSVKKVVHFILHRIEIVNFNYLK